jgi:hypothetical protein
LSTSSIKFIKERCNFTDVFSVSEEEQVSGGGEEEGEGE